MRAFSKFVTLLIALGAFSCHEEGPCGKGMCDLGATVRDYGGEDGCGFVLEGDNGKIYVPVSPWGWCGTGVSQEEMEKYPLYGFEWEDGKRVAFSFENQKGDWTNCASAKGVLITCFEELCNEDPGPSL